MSVLLGLLTRTIGCSLMELPKKLNLKKLKKMKHRDTMSFHILSDKQYFLVSIVKVTHESFRITVVNTSNGERLLWVRYHQGNFGL